MYMFDNFIVEGVQPELKLLRPCCQNKGKCTMWRVFLQEQFNEATPVPARIIGQGAAGGGTGRLPANLPVPDRYVGEPEERLAGAHELGGEH